MAEALFAGPAAAKVVQRGLDLVIDGIIDTVKYVSKIWSAYKDQNNDVQDVATYAKRVGELLETLKSSEKVTEDHRSWLEEDLEIPFKDIHQESKMLEKKISNAQTVGKAGNILMAPKIAGQLKELKAKLKGLVQNIYDAGDKIPFFTNLLKVPAAVLIDETHVEARAFWKSYNAEAWSMKFTELVALYNHKARVSSKLEVRQVSDGRNPSDPLQGEAGGSKAPGNKIPLDKSESAAEAVPAEPRAYKVLSSSERQALLYALCHVEGDDGLPKKLSENDEEITCFRLNTFCNKYGWPFIPEDLPSPPKFGVLHSMAERLSVADLHQKLQAEFSTKDMSDAMSFVRATVDNVVKDMEKHMSPSGVIYLKDHYGPHQLQTTGTLQEEENTKAEEKFLKAQLRCFAAGYLYRPTREEERRTSPIMRPDKPYRPRVKTIRDVLDEHRRTWSYMFQRFSTMWKLGQLTEQLFEGIDFPGTGRAITFMEYCEPLDEANFRLVLKKTKGEWKKSRPEVYSFLRAWLQYKDDMAAAQTLQESPSSGTTSAPSSSGLPSDTPDRSTQTGQESRSTPADDSQGESSSTQSTPSRSARADPVLQPGTGPDSETERGAVVNNEEVSRVPQPSDSLPQRPRTTPDAAASAPNPGPRLARAPADVLFGGRPRPPQDDLDNLIPYKLKTRSPETAERDGTTTFPLVGKNKLVELAVSMGTFLNQTRMDFIRDLTSARQLALVVLVIGLWEGCKAAYLGRWW